MGVLEPVSSANCRMSAWNFVVNDSLCRRRDAFSLITESATFPVPANESLQLDVASCSHKSKDHSSEEPRRAWDQRHRP